MTGIGLQIQPDEVVTVGAGPLTAGDVIAVEAFGARDGSRIGNAKAVTMTSTGQKLLAAPNQN